MGMGFGLAVRADVPMDIQIRDHAARDKLLGDEIAGKVDTLRLVHLARNRKLNLAGKLRVLALLGGLDLVPEGFPIRQAFGRTLGQHDLAMLDARLGAKIMVAVEAFVVQPLASSIGGGCNATAPAGTAYDLNAEMVDRHSDIPSTASSARRHDV